MEGNRHQVDVFDRDAGDHAGYLYTHTSRLSCKLATQRSADLILETRAFEDRRVLDLACGDAYFTGQFMERGHPAQLVASDAAVKAVGVGARNHGSTPIRFLAADAHRMPFADDSFDLVLIQSVLHHDDHPAGLIREAFRMAPRVLIHEPNGNNPGLKVIEKTSRYHREHGEKSYSPRRLRQWIREANGSVVYEKTGGFVPMFCPDWMAKGAKLIEPALEATPLIRWLGCAVFVMLAERGTAR